MENNAVNVFLSMCEVLMAASALPDEACSEFQPERYRGPLNSSFASRDSAQSASHFRSVSLWVLGPTLLDMFSNSFVIQPPGIYIARL